MSDSEDMTEKVINEQFEEVVSDTMKEAYQDEFGREPDVDDKRKLIALQQSEDYRIEETIRVEKKVEKIDEEDLSEESKKSIERTKRKLDMSKKLKEETHDMDWDEIKEKWREGYFTEDLPEADI